MFHPITTKKYKFISLSKLYNNHSRQKKYHAELIDTAMVKQIRGRKCICTRDRDKNWEILLIREQLGDLLRRDFEWLLLLGWGGSRLHTVWTIDRHLGHLSDSGTWTQGHRDKSRCGVETSCRGEKANYWIAFTLFLGQWYVDLHRSHYCDALLLSGWCNWYLNQGK